MIYQPNVGFASQNDVGDLQNDERTSSRSDTNGTQPGSRPVRFRLISPDGKAYAAFRLKEGVPLYHVTRELRGVGWQVEVVES